MDQLEKVEKIREKTGVTYDEAKRALEAADGDVLDALVYLENQGKIKKPEVSVYTTKVESDSSAAFKKAAESYEESTRTTKGGQMKKFFKWCGTLIQKGCENFFIVSRHGEDMITAPVLLLVVLLLFAFWAVVPLMVVGLFFDFHYRFQGNITKAVDVNMACDKAAEAAENIKQEFHHE